MKATNKRLLNPASLHNSRYDDTEMGGKTSFNISEHSNGFVAHIPTHRTEKGIRDQCDTYLVTITQ
jgi:hypothetical protein